MALSARLVSVAFLSTLLVVAPAMGQDDGMRDDESAIEFQFAEIRKAFLDCDGEGLMPAINDRTHFPDWRLFTPDERAAYATRLARDPLQRTWYQYVLEQPAGRPLEFSWPTFLARDCRENRDLYRRYFEPLALAHVAVEGDFALTSATFDSQPINERWYWHRRGKDWLPEDIYQAVVVPLYLEKALGRSVRSVAEAAAQTFVQRHGLSNSGWMRVSTWHVVDLPPTGNGRPSASPPEEVLLERLADRGDVVAAYDVAVTKREQGGDAETVRFLRIAAEGDYAPAQDLLGLFYQDGLGGLPSDCRLALHWLQRAADNGFEESANHVAWVFATATDAGCRDPARAVALAESVVADNEERKVEASLLYGAIDTLAAAHCAAGNFERAIELQQRVVENASQPKRAKRLEMYRAHTCWTGASNYAKNPQ